MYVEGITKVPVDSPKEVLDIMTQGYRNRATFATNMNEHSSRSHSMLSVYIDGRNSVTNLRFKGKLHLIDLAGSERVSKSGAVGARFEEVRLVSLATGPGPFSQSPHSRPRTSTSRCRRWATSSSLARRRRATFRSGTRR